jgi:hypothetical protein
MAQLLAAGLAAKALGNVSQNLLPVAGDVIQGGSTQIGGAIGSLFGKKGARVGKKIGGGIAKFGRKLLGFQSGGVVTGGGKVRVTPVKIKGGYVMGGEIVPNKPKRKKGKGKRKK